jgi:hypothetical protein
MNGRPVTEPDLTNRFEVGAGGNVIEFGEADVLWLNDGRGHFTAAKWSATFSDEAGQPVPGADRDWGLAAQFHDFDGDGRRDLLVAEFGWRTTGALRVLPGAAEEGAAEETGGGEVVLDPRHGVLDVRVADLDGDGREDIVAAFAQEHETVDAWYALGGGEFEHRELYRGNDPSWGSSGFELADMDGDGDLDILHANGDTMDTGLARPTHGIRILVNEGENRFRVEEIARMPGVSQASAADLDGDGDLDLVAAALHLGAAEAPPGTFDSLLWVEQGNGGEWFPHMIERNRCHYAAFTLADVDGDRRTDIVAGIWQSAVTGQAAPALSVWLNRRADH